jgi:putative ATP-dependent endonuclease of OLD family
LQIDDEMDVLLDPAGGPAACVPFAVGRRRDTHLPDAMGGPRMRLSRLTVANFRSCQDVQLDLAEDLTVLVGENASGKSAIIDALRLATTPAIEGSGLAFTAEFDPTQLAEDTAEVKISAVYDDLTVGKQAIYLAELVDFDDTLTYNVTYSRDIDLPYWRSAKHSVGSLGVEDPEPINRRRSAHVYLRRCVMPYGNLTQVAANGSLKC